ncbi:MAG: S8 family serine peptidase [Kiritimatiellales bacterium]|nr:S8 family serine peptidase [Kiritimatiellales bacterium]
MFRTAYILLFMLTAALVAPAEVREFRMDQDRLWLRAAGEPLPGLLEHFATAGVQVQIDPAAQKTVGGLWQDADVEKTLDLLLAPYDYRLDWRRETGPLGSRITLTGIRVFRKGFAEAARPLKSLRRIATTIDGRTRYLAREILIGFGPGSTMDDLNAFLARTGGTVITANTQLGIYRILLPDGVNVPDLAAQLANDPQIALAEPNYIYDLPGLLPGDTATGAPKEWTPPSGEGTLSVAVLDSGLLYNEGLSAAVLSAFDATNPDAPLSTDAVGHGTLMAQLAAGLVDPYNTAVGEGVPVVAIKAFADDGSADAFTLMNAMTYAVEKSTGPVSLSWGSETRSQFIEQAVNYAINHGSPVFAAVGNENTGRPMYPAAYPGVIGVAAGTEDGQYTEYSNRGDFVDLIAPGSAGGSQGTSVATAYAAHIAAKYMRHNPDGNAAKALLEAAGPDHFLSAEDVRQLLSR